MKDRLKENYIIEGKNISKTFRIPHEKAMTMKQAAFGLFSKKSYTEFRALQNVSFNISEGEFFGIIGRNGSGKSTLLKIIAGIYMLDSGELNIKGKISPFLELGVGFNPELSGKENIFLNGAILGLSRKEIAEKFDEIVDFSELKDFIDQKLKNYSSGMQVRLAFSVAIHAHAPIILLDEVLAVGDLSFQEKCFKIFNEMKKSKKTIIFVSHDMSAMQKFCDRVLLLDKGVALKIDKPEKIIQEYRHILGV